MTLRFASLFADAGVFWRAERQLLVRVAGVFFLLPMLGIILLIAASAPPLDVPAEQVGEALSNFYRSFTQANLVPLALANFAMDFGIFGVLTLYLRGNGRSLGAVLADSLKRLFPFLVLELITGLLFSLGFSLFVVPGLFLFARTWLVAPAYAAQPETGLLGAFREGWLRSAGWNWVVVLLATGAVFVAGLGAMAIASVVTGLIATAAGGGQVSEALGYLVLSAIAACVWTALTVLRAAAYRATEPRQGM